MSLEIKIPKEITKYEAKLIGPLTTRQTVCLIPGFGAAILAKMLCDQLAPSITGMAMILVFIPFGLLGFVKVYEMPFEQFAVGWFKTRFLAPSKRKTIVKNQFAIIDKEMEIKDTKKKAKYKKSKLAYK